MAGAPAILALLVLASRGSAAPDGSATSEGPVRISYGDDPAQHGVLHLPDRDGPHPAVVMIHGGFWLARYDASLMTPLAQDLAGRGYAVWNIEYRRVGNGGGWPQTFDDVATAVDHIVDLAREHRLDLDRLVVVGHSAGGHLAAWLAARPGLPAGAPGADPAVPIRGVISQAGILDLRAAAEQRLGGGSTQRFLGGDPTEVPDRYEFASPIERLPIDVPVVAIHGDTDDLVPPDQTERYIEAAVTAGDQARGVLIEDEGHFEHLDTRSASWATTVHQLDLLMEDL